ALAPQKMTLTHFVSSVEIQATNPFNSCQIRVAVGLKGLAAVPDFVPHPKPADFGGAVAQTPTASPGSAAIAQAAARAH
ncbi:MAG TPA: hypothetical protein VLZ84_12035, partial [Asticcacaulis sp.]|nr:hypothetical protein [Asticcacaulis sp.]